MQLMAIIASIVTEYVLAETHIITFKVRDFKAMDTEVVIRC